MGTLLLGILVVVNVVLLVLLGAVPIVVLAFSAAVLLDALVESMQRGPR